MAIVRSLEGTFYEIPDGELENYKVPPDQVKKLMESAGQQVPQGPGSGQKQMGQQQMGQGAGQGARGGPQILVQFITQTAPVEQQQMQGQSPPAEGGEEKVEPQWWWVNWYNWANWYNWY